MCYNTCKLKTGGFLFMNKEIKKKIKFLILIIGGVAMGSLVILSIISILAIAAINWFAVLVLSAYITMLPFLASLVDICVTFCSQMQNKKQVKTNSIGLLSKTLELEKNNQNKWSDKKNRKKQKNYTPNDIELVEFELDEVLEKDITKTLKPKFPTK